MFTSGHLLSAFSKSVDGLEVIPESEEEVSEEGGSLPEVMQLKEESREILPEDMASEVPETEVSDSLEAETLVDK